VVRNRFPSGLNTNVMSENKKVEKLLAIGLMVSGVLCLNYFTFPTLSYRHAFYRILFYLPLVFGCIWFGLKGALFVTASVFFLYVPYVASSWQGFTLEDFHKILEALLFVVIALILGTLVERERKKSMEILKIERLAALGRATMDTLIRYQVSAMIQVSVPSEIYLF
jgi:hypothetical protein